MGRRFRVDSSAYRVPSEPSGPPPARDGRTVPANCMTPLGEADYQSLIEFLPCRPAVLEVFVNSPALSAIDSSRGSGGWSSVTPHSKHSPWRPPMSEPTSISSEILWTIREVAARLRVAPNTVRNAIEAGHLGALRLPGRGRGILRIPENAVREYLESHVYQPQRSKRAASSPKGRPLRYIKLSPDDAGS